MRQLRVCVCGVVSCCYVSGLGCTHTKTHTHTHTLSHETHTHTHTHTHSDDVRVTKPLGPGEAPPANLQALAALASPHGALGTYVHARARV